jgi:serine/threonine protein kinase
MIGRGEYGKVFRAVDKRSGRHVAIKAYVSVTAHEDLCQELSAYRAVHSSSRGSEFFLQVISSGHLPTPWMCLSHGPPSLHHYMRDFGAIHVEFIGAVVRQLIMAARTLHSKGLAHLDIKPGNVLWHPALLHLYLIDLGCVEAVPIVKPVLPIRTEYVTFPYRPPELWNVKISELGDALTAAVDTFSVGATVFEAATTHRMFVAFGGELDVQGTHAMIRAWSTAHAKMWTPEGLVSCQSIECPAACKLLERLHRLPPEWRRLVYDFCNPNASKRPALNLSYLDGCKGM